MDHVPTVWAYDVELPPHASSASRARDFVGLHLVEHDLSHLADDVRLAVSELATNALTHSLTPFTVTLAVFGPTVLLKVEDRSPCLPVLGAGTALGACGRGLTILDLLSIDWGVTAQDDGGNTVWATFGNAPQVAAARRCGTIRHGTRTRPAFPTPRRPDRCTRTRPDLADDG